MQGSSEVRAAHAKGSRGRGAPWLALVVAVGPLACQEDRDGGVPPSAAARALDTACEGIRDPRARLDYTGGWLKREALDRDARTIALYHNWRSQLQIHGDHLPAREMALIEALWETRKGGGMTWWQAWRLIREFPPRPGQ